MVKQTIDVESYWEVIVYYDVDYDLFNAIEVDLLAGECPESLLNKIWSNMRYGRAKAVTYSNIRMHICIVLFNPHEDRHDYINSIVHEAEHVKQAMLQAYNVGDYGEPPAYTIGYLVGRMWEVFKNLVCRGCNSTATYKTLG